MDSQPGLMRSADPSAEAAAAGAAGAAEITAGLHGSQQEGDDLAEQVAASRALCTELERQRAQHASWQATHLADRQKRQAEVQQAILQCAMEHIAAGAVVKCSPALPSLLLSLP